MGGEGQAATGHVPVLLHEAVEALNIVPEGVYVDGTFGRGGHSREILRRLGPEGRLFGVDQDPQAVEAGRALAGQDRRFHMQHASFADLAELVAAWGVAGRVNGILLDLGVSSPQLDEAERGFSFMHDGPLDMRMNTTTGRSAAQWLADAEEKEIARVLWEYGEEKQARRIARAIVEQRQEKPIQTTGELAALIERVMPRARGRRFKHPATRSFQALRIKVNDELGALKRGLEAGVDALVSGGRLAVISFHSLEDRLVKRFMRDLSRPRQVRKGLPPVTDHIRLKRVGKAVRAGEAELEANPRARSAVLRVGEKL